MRFLLNLYPPFLFQGIRVLSIEEDFRGARVRVAKSLLTRNVMGTTFGGALMSAADPLFPLLYWKSLVKKGEYLSVWLKSLDSTFLIPATESVFFDFRLDPDKLEAARLDLIKLDAPTSPTKSTPVSLMGKRSLDSAWSALYACWSRDRLQIHPEMDRLHPVDRLAVDRFIVTKRWKGET